MRKAIIAYFLSTVLLLQFSMLGAFTVSAAALPVTQDFSADISADDPNWKLIHDSGVVGGVLQMPKAGSAIGGIGFKQMLDPYAQPYEMSFDLKSTRIVAGSIVTATYIGLRQSTDDSFPILNQNLWMVLKDNEIGIQGLKDGPDWGQNIQGFDIAATGVNFANMTRIYVRDYGCIIELYADTVINGFTRKRHLISIHTSNDSSKAWREGYSALAVDYPSQIVYPANRGTLNTAGYAIVWAHLPDPFSELDNLTIKPIEGYGTILENFNDGTTQYNRGDNFAPFLIENNALVSDGNDHRNYLYPYIFSKNTQLSYKVAATGDYSMMGIRITDREGYVDNSGIWFGPSVIDGVSKLSMRIKKASPGNNYIAISGFPADVNFNDRTLGAEGYTNLADIIIQDVGNRIDVFTKTQAEGLILLASVKFSAGSYTIVTDYNIEGYGKTYTSSDVNIVETGAIKMFTHVGNTTIYDDIKITKIPDMPQAELSTFEIGNYRFDIDNENGRITYPFKTPETDLEAKACVFTAPEGSVVKMGNAVLESGVSVNNFNQQKLIVVTNPAYDTAKVYTLEPNIFTYLSQNFSAYSGNDPIFKSISTDSAKIGSFQAVDGQLKIVGGVDAHEGFLIDKDIYGSYEVSFDLYKPASAVPWDTFWMGTRRINTGAPVNNPNWFNFDGNDVGYYTGGGWGNFDAHKKIILDAAKFGAGFTQMRRVWVADDRATNIVNIYVADNDGAKVLVARLTYLSANSVRWEDMQGVAPVTVYEGSTLCGTDLANYENGNKIYFWMQGQVEPGVVYAALDNFKVRGITGLNSMDENAVEPMYLSANVGGQDYKVDINTLNNASSVKIKLRNTNEIEKSIKAIIAYYDANGVLIKAIMSDDATLAGDGTAEITTNISGISAAAKVKVFVWDSESIRPYMSELKF